MSQANSDHTIAPPPTTHLFAGPLSLIGDNGSSMTRGGDCYVLQTATERLVVDPRQKGDTSLAFKLALTIQLAPCGMQVIRPTSRATRCAKQAP